MTRPFVLQKAAEEDLRAIIRYTRDTWGGAQARLYASQLQTGIERLVAGEGTFKSLLEVHPGLRVARCQSHYIFCLMRETGPALVVAILHHRMDLVARLSTRLDPT